MKNSPNQFESRRRAFTLIELLVVISIIAVLAAFLIPTLKGVKNAQIKKRAAAELALVETAIERYKAARGFYPPDNPSGALINQLYYELLGTTNTSDPGTIPIVFKTLDNSAQIDSDKLNSAFGLGVSALINCSKHNMDEDSKPAQSFLTDLKPSQWASLTINGVTDVHLLVCSVSGDPSYKPVGVADVNPWRYAVGDHATNNPGEFDLYVDIVVSGKTNRISNWSKQPQIVQ